MLSPRRKPWADGEAILLTFAFFFSGALPCTGIDPAPPVALLPPLKFSPYQPIFSIAWERTENLTGGCAIHWRPILHGSKTARMECAPGFPARH